MYARTENRKFHYLYKITRDDNKFYIGIHSTDNLDDGYFGSGKKITRSIKKYGTDRHRKEVLQFFETRDLLKSEEKRILTEELRSNVLCMNIAPGGGGGFINSSHQSKCSAAGGAKGGASTANMLKNNTEFAHAFKEKLSKSIRQYLTNNPEKIKEYQLRRTEAAASEKANNKRKSTFEKIGHSKGEKNSQFGKKFYWICHELFTSRKIEKNLIAEYLDQGWTRGIKYKN